MASDLGKQDRDYMLLRAAAGELANAVRDRRSRYGIGESLLPALEALERLLSSEPSQTVTRPAEHDIG